jgi:DNA-binding MarR family transcriptional regulator
LEEGGELENNDYIEKVRRFNRFYTRVIGVNNQYTDKTKYSSTEAQILYEISIKDRCTAVYISDFFNLDKGYLSRLLKRFEMEQLIRKVSSLEDKRISYLHITDKGIDELHLLIDSSNQIVKKMIAKIPKDRLNELIQSMRTIEGIFNEYENEL